MKLHIELLVVDFHLEGCRSLKEKRSRLVGLRDKLGRQPNFAVCQSDFLDSHQHAQWSFVAAASDKKIVDRILESVEEAVDESVDAVVVGIHRERL